jgi:hypothetical protein
MGLRLQRAQYPCRQGRREIHGRQSMGSGRRATPQGCKKARSDVQPAGGLHGAASRQPPHERNGNPGLSGQGRDQGNRDIREGLIRSIFKNSNADFARDEAGKYQVVCGEGYFSLCMEYASDDVFEQEIKINAVVDPYSVVLDPLAIEPSGEDAQWGFIGDDIPQQEFKRRWPWAAEVGFLGEKRWNQSGFWLSEDTIRIVSYWRMVTEGTRPSRSTRTARFTTSPTRKNSSISRTSKPSRTVRPSPAKCPTGSRKCIFARATIFSKGRTTIRFRRSRFTGCRVGSLTTGKRSTVGA